MQCPVCQDRVLEEAGRTMRCAQCDGAWIAEETLVALLEQRTSSLVSLPWKDRTDNTQHPCAECQVAMQTVNLGDVALDRCQAHGVWFDADELTALLKQSKRFKTEPGDDSPNEHKGLLDVLRGLLRR